MPYHAPQSCAQSSSGTACVRSNNPAIRTPLWLRNASGRDCSQPVVGSGISTERAIGVIGFYGGGNSIHNMGFLHRNPCHGRQIDDIVEPHVLFLPILRVVTVDGGARAIHEYPYDQLWGTLVPSRHPLHHRKGGLDNQLHLLEAFRWFVGILGDPGEEL